MGLVVLFALDAVLVGVALRPTNVSGVDTRPGSSAVFPLSPSSSMPSGAPSDPPPTSSTTAIADAATTAATPLQIVLVAVDDKQAWRVHTGSCSAGGATMATTTDGGRTWADTTVPLRTIVRVRPTGHRVAFVIGADSPCTAALRNTIDGGATWASTIDVGDAWFRDPKSPNVVAGPGRSTSRPCAGQAVVDLAALSPRSARVLCADGLVRSTTNTGSAWTDSGKAIGAVALDASAASPAQTFVARLNAPDCAGVEIWRVDQKAATSCVTVATLPKDPGQIALSLVTGGGWLSVGDTTMRSTDGLVTWSVS